MRRWVTAVVAVLVTLTTVSACTSESGPVAVARAFLEGWPAEKIDSVGFVDPNGLPLTADTVMNRIKEISGDLKVSEIKLVPTGEASVNGAIATVPVGVTWRVDGTDWKYQTSVKLAQSDGNWRVIWQPNIVHPDLKAGEKLITKAIPAPRGDILDNAGQPIVKPRPVIVVGIEPRRIVNQAALLSELAAAFKSVGVNISLDDLPGRIASAKPDAFIEVVTLRREVYDQIRARIQPLDGTVFQDKTLLLAPTRAFARALLGSVGDVRRDQIEANPGRYAVGDQVGQGGLQEQYDVSLRGRAGVSVLRSAGDDKATELFKREPAQGTALKTTLDQNVQNAADAALAGYSQRSALVAIRITDGAIVAVANGPDGGDLNLAFTASVPPGSTFKMVSALNLLSTNSVDANTVVACPKTYTVDGRVFTNAGGFVLGNVPFHVDFAKSCNTAFAALAQHIPGGGLTSSAATLGIGTGWSIGTQVSTGSVPVDGTAAEQAAAAFGQGKTVVSPVTMAVATATVARGSWLPPALFSQLPSGAPGPAAGLPAPPERGTALDADAVSALHTMMREVVTAGTATALADVPGKPVSAKTGTAEFDNNPAHTHAWTVGWQGDIAFAVFVENGGASSATAVPIVEAFLRGLA